MIFAHQEFLQVFVVGDDSIVDDNELCRPEMKNELVDENI